MELITYQEKPAFNSIKRRGFLRAKHISWKDWRNGLVSYVDETTIKALYLTGVNTAASYFTVKVEEAAAGAWELVYSDDLILIESWVIDDGGTDSPETDDDTPA